MISGPSADTLGPESYERNHSTILRNVTQNRCFGDSPLLLSYAKCRYLTGLE